ncbi:hypothetical protein ECG_07572 [Echinococcus granulosus]|nr:hypothetical protein ECG_07572 [Echinococcus granulosus]
MQELLSWCKTAASATPIEDTGNHDCLLRERDQRIERPEGALADAAATAGIAAQAPGSRPGVDDVATRHHLMTSDDCSQSRRRRRACKDAYNVN